MAAPKIEKKVIDEKIAKVREVVRNVSTNDIVLALHNFELDVNRTIQAFCEGGSESALGDWEKTGGTKKRNHKKKPNKGVSSQNASQASSKEAKSDTPSTPYSPSTTSMADRTPSINGGSTAADLSMLDLGKLELNGCALRVNGGGPIEVPQQFVDKPASNNVPKARGAASNPKYEVNDSFGLGNYQVHLDQNKSIFETELISADGNLRHSFEAIREVLALREGQLLTELSECRKNGLSYFASRKSLLTALIEENGNKTKSKSFASKLEKFNADKTEDLETALTERFRCDTSLVISSISQLGKVVTVNLKTSPTVAAAAPIPAKVESKAETLKKPSAEVVVEKSVKRSHSPSSLVSSVGEDSGLGGQISPVNNHHQEKGPVAQVEENGIVLKSDCVSADQLAEIQRMITESLKAKGIDPSVLSDINTTAPRRRAPPPAAVNKGNQGKGGGGNQRNPKAQNGEKRK